MKCPECQINNPDGVNFCHQCGTELEKYCSNCNCLNPPQSKFCGNCGSQISSQSSPYSVEKKFDEKITKIQRYLPSGLVERILSQKEKIEGERKQVTVLFCDMASFTHLSEGWGAEVAFDIMDQVYEILIHKVHDYEGTVNEMTGDGIMALFGAPIALEDAAIRAIQSSLAIHNEIAVFSENYLKEKKINSPIQMRVGIHTGPVIVGTLGNDLRVEFKAVGDTVNIAARLEKLARPGTTVISDETFKLAEGNFHFEALGERHIKGIEKPLSVYQAQPLDSKRSRFDIHVDRGLIPLIGRRRELDLLLESLDRVGDGYGHAITIVAEAGMGKSRLIYEFKQYVPENNYTFLIGNCLSYNISTAFFCIAEIFKVLFDIHDGNSDEEIRRKTHTALEEIGLCDENTEPYILELLSIENSGIENFLISQDAKRNRLFEAVKNVLFNLSKDKSLVLVFEDLHWIDQASMEIIKYLFKYISGSRILLILSYRPNLRLAWESKSYHSQVTLNRHTKRETLKFLSFLLGPGIVDPSLEQLIIDKTEGNPFFIEEFVRSMLEMGIINHVSNNFRLKKLGPEIMIPSTIQDVIMARIDHLPESAKELIQVCAVVEKEFSYEIIENVTNSSAKDLKAILSLLIDQELIYARETTPVSIFVFYHSLIREVIYNSILSKRRKELHARIAEAIILLYGDETVKYHSLLAEHYLRSGNYEKAIQYLDSTIQKEVRAALFKDAIYHANKKIDALEQLPQSEKIEDDIISSRVDCGRYLFLMNYFPEAKSTIDPIFDMALKGEKKAALSQIFMISGAYYYMIEENFPKALSDFSEAIQLSEESGDIIGSLISNYLLGLAFSWECEFKKTSHYIEKALEIFTEINSLWGIAIMKSLLSFYALNYQGKVKQGYKTSSEALNMAKKSDDILSQAMAFSCHGVSCFFKGKFEKSVKNLKAGLRLSERINLLSFGAIANHWLGLCYHEFGNYGDAESHFQSAIAIRKQSRLFPSSVLVSKLARLQSQAHKEPLDMNYPELRRILKQNRLKLYEGKLHNYVARLFLLSGTENLAEAEDNIRSAISSHKRYHMLWDLGHDHHTYAEILKIKNAGADSKEAMEKARAIFQECGARGWVKKLEHELMSS